MENKSDIDASKYPSVDLAFDFVRPSYDWMITRLDTINGKIQELLSFSATLTAALPVIAKAIFSEINYVSPWFIAAMIIFVVLSIIGILALRIGGISLTHPKTLYDKYLHLSHWEFQQRTLYWAGEHFEKNKACIDRKALFRDIIAIGLLSEILCLVIWIAV
jgi:hypothetical protein